MAQWLHGAPRDELGALARVITQVLRRPLRDTRHLCRGRPLLSVEAAARMVEALWPLLRSGDDDDASRESSPAPEEPDDGDTTPPPQSPPPDDRPDDADDDDADDGEARDDEESDGAGDGEGDGGSETEDEPADEGADGSDDDGTGQRGAAGRGPGQSATGSGGVSAGRGGSDDAQRMQLDEPVDPADVLAQLAELASTDDPELHKLADQLRRSLGGDASDEDIGAAAADLLDPAGQAASEGAIDTDKATRTLERFVPGIGWSDAPQEIEQTLLQRLDSLVRLLDALPDLRRIADALGRVEDATRKAGKKAGGREEVVGVRLGGEPSAVLPSELALLGSSTTEDLFYQRLVERRLVSLELTGSGDEGRAKGARRGPVIACIDTSASMQGSPELAAKALVLAVTRRVLRRGRIVHLILFGGPRQHTEIRLRRGLGGLEGLLDFLEASFHAGTDFDGPLLRAMDLLEEEALEDADVLVVTDGLCRATPPVVERVRVAREGRDVRIWSVVLGRHDVRGVAPFSDQVWALDPGDTSEAAGLIRKL